MFDDAILSMQDRIADLKREIELSSTEKLKKDKRALVGIVKKIETVSEAYRGAVVAILNDKIKEIEDDMRLSGESNKNRVNEIRGIDKAMESIEKIKRNLGQD